MVKRVCSQNAGNLMAAAQKVEIYSADNVDVFSQIAPILSFLVLSLLDPVFSIKVFLL